MLIYAESPHISPVSRYFFKISYNGKAYSGWQYQPNAVTVQGVIEDVLAKLLRTSIPIVGCGRTDAGVHARSFYFHADMPEDALQSIDLIFKLNQMLPHDIAIHDMMSVSKKAHARFDAITRAYEFDIHFKKSPFLFESSYYLPFHRNLKLDLLDRTAHLIQSGSEFAGYSKTGSDVKTTQCEMDHCRWIYHSDERITFHIGANRFLRGMVRLLVGASLNVALGKLDIDEFGQCLQSGKKPSLNWSVPAHGLFLTDISYPYIKR